MLDRFALLAAALAAPAFAQPASAPAPAPETVPVALDTSAGRIVVALDRARAPVTTANFLKYVDARRYDGETIYRAMPYGSGGLIQGGIRSSVRKLFPPIAFEGTDTTGLSNTAGSIAMAAAAPGKAQADFFIMTADIKAFDGPAGFAVFGKVVEGMDVVEKILRSPVSPDKGDGAMKGQMLDPPVRIVTVTRVK